MKRLTRLAAKEKFYTTDGITGKVDNEGYYGDAVEKLARFEDFYNHLIERRTAIPEEIETLRKAGKDKTVTFKELLTEKMVNQMILNQLEKYGLR